METILERPEVAVDETAVDKFLLWHNIGIALQHFHDKQIYLPDKIENVARDIMLNPSTSPIDMYHALVSEAGYSPGAAALAVATLHENLSH